MKQVSPRVWAILVAALGVLLVGIGLTSSEGNPAGVSSGQPDMQTASVVIDGKKVTLPLVDGNSTDTVNGTMADADPRTPKVRDGAVTPSWSDLDKLLGSDTRYNKCVDDTLRINWATDVPQFKQTEQNHQVTMILASNAKGLSRSQIIADARMESPSIPDSVKIVHANGIDNTSKKTCERFIDTRKNFVRAFVGVPVYDKDGRFVGVKNNAGVFHGCHNPWFIPGKITPTPTPSNSESPSASPSPSGSTTPPGTPSSSPPPSTSTPPPGTPTPKNPEKDPAQQDNSGNGGGKNEDPGPGEYKPPSQMDPPPDKPRTNPPAPSATKSTPPIVKPPSGGGGASETPTVDPGDDENDGTVPTEGCGNPDFC